MGAIFLIILVLVLLGTIPTYQHSRNWGYGPSGGVGLLLLILVVLILANQVPWWGYSTGVTPYR